MLSEREIYILDELKDSISCLTSKEISNKMKVSTRTIKRDIKNISKVLEVNGALLISSNKGYKISVNNFMKYNNFIENLFNLDMMSRISDLNFLSYVICYFMCNKFINQEKLCDNLFISRSTINKVIPKIKKEFLKYDIYLKSKPHYGYFIDGKERDIRNCLVEHLFKLEKFGDDKCIVEYKLSEYNNLVILIENIFLQNNFLKTDLEVSYITKYLLIAIVRNKYTVKFANSIEFNKLFSLKSNNIVNKIASCIEEKYNVILSEDNKIYLSYVIGNSNKDKINVYFKEIVQSALENIELLYDLNLSCDNSLKAGLENHISVNYFRYCLNLNIKNPFLDQIKSKYTQAYNYAILFVESIKVKYGIEIFSDDIGYISLHFAAFLERDASYNNTKAIIVCNGSMGNLEFIKSRIVDNIPTIDIIGVYPEYILSVNLIKNADIIITTEKVKSTFNKNVVNISHLCLREDISLINEYLKREREYEYLSSLFDENLFFINIEANDKYDAIDKLTNEMYNNGFINETLVESIKNREKIASTEINELVAIPHSITISEQKSIIAVGILKKQIRWSEKHVQLIFLGILNPKIQLNKKVFLMIYKLTKSKKRTERLISSQNIESFKYNLFN